MASAKDHPHRLLEYATTGLSSCKGKCKAPIKLGQLRYGTQVVVQEHRSMSWRCMGCITKKQADNFLADAEAAGLPPQEYLTVPPPRDAGGDGPEPAVVDTFLQYLSALSAEDHSRSGMLLKELSHHREPQAEPDEKKAEKNAVNLDTHTLDHQLRTDIDLIHLFSHDDMKALCLHHHLAGEGTKPELEQALREFYSEHHQQRAAAAHSSTSAATTASGDAHAEAPAKRDHHPTTEKKSPKKQKKQKGGC
jgi:hypothetical protein